jgi:hypothetical protein
MQQLSTLVACKNNLEDDIKNTGASPQILIALG